MIFLRLQLLLMKFYTVSSFSRKRDTGWKKHFSTTLYELQVPVVQFQGPWFLWCQTSVTCIGEKISEGIPESVHENWLYFISVVLALRWPDIQHHPNLPLLVSGAKKAKSLWTGPSKPKLATYIWIQGRNGEKSPHIFKKNTHLGRIMFLRKIKIPQ